MGIYCFLFLTGKVGPCVCSILEIAAPWADLIVTSGECFFCFVRSECLGVEWGVCLGVGFFQVGMWDLYRVIYPGVHLIMALAAPEDDIFSVGVACFFLWDQSECLGVARRFRFFWSWVGSFVFVWDWVLSRQKSGSLPEETKWSMG